MQFTSALSVLTALAFSTLGAARAIEPIQVNGAEAWFYVHCFRDNVGGRVLDARVEVPGGAANMTNVACLNECFRDVRYHYAGLEYGQECWCGVDVKNNNYPVLKGCSMPCTGAKNETCGGSDRIDVYARII